MDGQTIKFLRRNRGMTQNDVAAALSVDQGTVSRWERGIEVPRPSSQAILHKILFAPQGDSHDRNRVDTILKHGLYQAGFADDQCRLVAFSSSVVDFYKERFGVDLNSFRGKPFNSLLDRLGQSEILKPIEDYGLMKGIHVWSRCYTNAIGVVVCNEFESIFENGVFVGTLMSATGRYRIVDNDVRNVVKIEAIFLDAPDKLVTVYEGQFAEYARAPGDAL